MNREWGKAIECKFCGKTVWYDKITRRVYESDSDTMHVNNCERRRQHYKQRAFNQAESRRQSQ